MPAFRTLIPLVRHSHGYLDDGVSSQIQTQRTKSEAALQAQVATNCMPARDEQAIETRWEERSAT